jgi:hypothetical protein
VGADIQAYLARPDVRFQMTPDVRLVDFREMHSVSGIDQELFVVDLLKEAAFARRPPEPSIVSGAEKCDERTLPSKASADVPGGAAQDIHLLDYPLPLEIDTRNPGWSVLLRL